MISFWQRILSGKRAGNLPIDPRTLSMPDWEFVRQESRAAYWRDTAGDVVSLTLSPRAHAFPPLSDVRKLQDHCRNVAESQGAGLIEVASTAGAEGACVTYIYKRLNIPAFTFFSVAATPLATGLWIWMIIAYERGTTGVREAVVTSQLFESGQLTLESYEASWAQDPYDALYQGVDRRTLRYRSDAADYDEDFPNHPLSKVRRELRRLTGIPLCADAAAKQIVGREPR